MFDVKDIKGKIDQMVERIKTDDDLKAQFKKDPIKAVESVLGVDLPDEAVKKIIAETKSKLSTGAEKAGAVGGSAAGKAGEVLGDAAGKAGEVLGDAAGKVTGAVSGAADAIKKKLF